MFSSNSLFCFQTFQPNLEVVGGERSAERKGLAEEVFYFQTFQPASTFLNRMPPFYLLLNSFA